MNDTAKLVVKLVSAVGALCLAVLPNAANALTSTKVNKAGAASKASLNNPRLSPNMNELGTKGANQPVAPNTAAGASTASLTTLAPPPVKKITLTLMNQSQVSQAAVIKNEAAPSGINRFQLSYNLSDTKIVMFREDSSFRRSANNQSTDYHINDPFLAYTDTQFLTLPGDWVLTVQPRIYLPLGENTRFVTKALGSEGLALLADKALGRFNFEFVGFGQYVNNTQDYSYDYKSSQGRWIAVPNRDFTVFGQGEIAYNLTDRLQIIHDVIYQTDVFRSSPDRAARAEHTIVNETTLAYSPMKQLKIMASVENNASEAQGFTMYQESETLYNLYLKLSL